MVIKEEEIRNKMEGIGEELVNIEMVIGKKEEVMEMDGDGWGVMGKEMKRIVDKLRSEGGKRNRIEGGRIEIGIEDIIVCWGKIRKIEKVEKRMGKGNGEGGLKMWELIEGEMDGNRSRGLEKSEGKKMIENKEEDMLEKIMKEKIEKGEGWRIVEGGREMEIWKKWIKMGEDRSGKEYLRIEWKIKMRRNLEEGKFLKRREKERGVEIVKFKKGGKGWMRVDKKLRINKRRGFNISKKWMLD